MSRKELQQETFDKLVSDYIVSRNNAGFHYLKLAEVVAEAKQKLSRKMYNKFLNNSNIKLKKHQANKLLAVYQLSKVESRLTDFFNKEGVEKAYLLTTLKDESTRNTFIEKVIDVPFTVKQTKQAIQKITAENFKL